MIDVGRFDLNAFCFPGCFDTILAGGAGNDVMRARGDVRAPYHYTLTAWLDWIHLIFVLLFV
jgi:hypothetical protein